MSGLTLRYKAAYIANDGSGIMAALMAIQALPAQKRAALLARLAAWQRKNRPII